MIDGLPPGIMIDEVFIAKEMARRAPGRDVFATARKESDAPRIVSGVKDGCSTGAPIVCVIENSDQRSHDYDTALRPGHADWTSLLKYGTAADRAGGGRFSGRLTAPLVFAGAIAKLALSEKGIGVYGRIKSIGNERDAIDLSSLGAVQSASAPPADDMISYLPPAEDILSYLSKMKKELQRISGKDFPAADQSEQVFKNQILAAKSDGDSVGGTIEVAAFGRLGGIGDPFFASVESTLSSLYFSVPAVKGVEFGKGFAISELRGSEANDPLILAAGSIISAKNDNGGILGGIANGMPIVARVAVKPTSSIAREQRTVDPGAGDAEGAHLRETAFKVRGRHDPSIVPRAVPVIEAVTAIGILDLLYQK
jgi:chorismate synthase